MVERCTPSDITSYWVVEDTQENIILQENELHPRYMDEKYCYYELNKHFVDVYLKLINEDILLKRINEFNTVVRKGKNSE